MIAGDGGFATDLHNPDFASYANGCGALGIRISNKNEVAGAMKTILDHKGTALLEIMTDVSLI